PEGKIMFNRLMQRNHFVDRCLVLPALLKTDKPGSINFFRALMIPCLDSPVNLITVDVGALNTLFCPSLLPIFIKVCQSAISPVDMSFSTSQSMKKFLSL